MAKINIHNISNHAETFEVHGWGQNTTTVGAGQMHTFDAANGSSGAIIAMHNGREGEQVEVTKGSSEKGTNDVFDTSVLVGSGGNITVQQWGDASTRKGAPHYMQDANKAWKTASQNVKNSIRSSITLDKNGNVIFIGPTKASKALEDFVRSFANGTTYIGVGAVPGSPGNPADNAQSFAANGIKDLIITYSDGDATPTVGRVVVFEKLGVQPPADSLAYRTNVDMTLVRPEHAVARAAVTAKGPGIILENKSHDTCTYNFFDNAENGNGWAVPTFDHPTATVTMKAGASQFVSLHDDFKGRIQRGSLQPSTWVEFQIKATDGQAWGDISLEMGCDGSSVISATDGSGHTNGFSNEIVSGAPQPAKVRRSDGKTVLDTTQGYWGGGPNHAAVEYEQKVVGQKKAYILGGSGTYMVMSRNNCLKVDMY